MHLRRLLASVLGWLVFASHGAAQVITTLAGTAFAFPSLPLPAINAPLGNVSGVATDTKGNVYISDASNNVVVRIGPDGTLTVVAGNGTQGFSGDGGPAASAALNAPAGIAVDPLGNLYIADYFNQRIRVVSDGIINTFAGNGMPAFSGDGGPPTSAALSYPTGVAADSNGNVYIADQGNNRIRRVAGRVIITFAGNGTQGFSGDGGAPTGAKLYGATAVAVDSAGALYIADTGNSRIRKISGGVITTVAGNGTYGSSGDGGLATNATLGHPSGIAVDSAGSLYISDPTSVSVRKVSGGVINTIAGNGNTDFLGDLGPATSAALNNPQGVAVDSAGNVYIADRNNNRVRRVSNAIILTVAGDGGYKFAGDGGVATLAALQQPQAVALDASGAVYIADTANNRVRKVSGGIISTVAGNGTAGYSGDQGPAVSAELNMPVGVAVDAAGNLFISDSRNSVIRKVTGGIIITFAGGGVYPFSGDGGPATSAAINGATGIAVDASGNLYIADSNNHRIRKITAGVITTVVGNGVEGFSGDGGPATAASLDTPMAVAIDLAGNLYIADEQNHRIRKVSGGTISTVAGNGTRGFSGDGGLAVSANLNYPDGVAVDSAGSLYIADSYNNRIRKVSGGMITTLAGNGQNGFSGDGGPPNSAAIYQPAGVAVDSSGTVYFADEANDRVREVLNRPLSFQASPTSLSFAATAAGPPTAAQIFTLSPSLPGLAFSAASIAPWLTITPSSGTMPAVLQVVVDPTNLTAGTTYSTTIMILARAATPQTQTISVSVVVSPAIPGSLATSAASIAFSFPQGSNPGSQQLTISNLGSGSIQFTASASTTTGGNWLSVAGTSLGVTSVSPASITVTADPGSLGVGSYSGIIIIASPATGQQIVLPVTLAISAPPQVILLSQTGFSFTAVAQGGTVLPQTLDVLNGGSGTLNFSVQATTQPGGSGWLNVSANSGTVVRPLLDVAPVDVSVNAQGLAPGVYYGQITVSSNGASNSPQTAVVILTVLPAGTNPGPVVSPRGLVFTGTAGAVSPGSQSITVADITANPTTFGSSIAYVGDGGWIKYQPTDFTVQPNAPTQIVVQPDFSMLSAGPHRAVLTLAFDDGSIQTVSILAVAAAGSSSGASFQDGPRREVGSCSPTTLLPQFRQVGFGSSVTVSYPADVEVQVFDDCGAAVTDGSVVVSFSNGDTPLSLISLQNGNWTSSWQPSHAVPTVSLSAQAQTPTAGLNGTTAPFTTALQQTNQLPPVLSGLPLGPFAPGDLMLLKGLGLADGQASSNSAPLPQQLAGVTVYVGGGRASLLYADVGQVLALVPPGVPANTSQQVILQRDNALAIAAPAIIASAHPAVLTKDGSGQGQGLVYDAGLLADSSNPVKAGDAILIYCTGLGLTDASGNATNTVQLTIGGQPAQVSYAGVAVVANYPSAGAPTVLGGQAQIGLGGLYQITATVPGGVLGGPASILVSLAGQASPVGVTIAVAGPAGSAPLITSVNTAYGTSDISQNDFIEIHGTNLAPSTAGPSSLISTLNGVSVTVNNKPALLYYVSSTQINALTPLDNTTGPVSIVVTNNTVSSTAFPANVRTVTPSFLLFDVNKHITATHADGSYLGPGSLGSAFTPGAPGETIVTYAVGFGLPSTTLVSGSPTQTGTLPTLPVCQISGLPATVAFAGLNQFAGLYQLNLVIPAGAPNGDDQVSCTYGGQTTPAGTVVSVQR